MKAPRWHALFDRRKTHRLSALSGALARVRTIRKDCHWNISTTPERRAKRRERVLQARKTVHPGPGPCDIPGEVDAPGLKHRRWLWPIGPYVVFCLAVVWVILVTERPRPNPVYRFLYQLPRTGAVLSEELALATAQQALSNLVNRLAEWKPIERGDTQVNGARDAYLVRQSPNDPNAGFVLLSDPLQTGVVWAVRLQLQANGISGTVSKVEAKPSR